MTTCPHLDQMREVAPRSNGCEDCLRIGDTWVHLRLCMTCGHVGCCDQSKNKHATRHSHSTGHPIIRSFEPGEDWGWCYRDQLFLDASRWPVRGPVAHTSQKWYRSGAQESSGGVTRATEEEAMSRGKKSDDGIRRPHVETSDDLADGPSADQFTEEHASPIPWAEDRPIVREDEKYTGSHTPVTPAHRRSVSRRRNTLNEGDRTVARSVTGLFTEQTQVDRIVGALIDAGFDAERISAVSPDDQAAGTATPAVQPTPSGRGLAAWLVDHLRRRGLSHEHAQRYHQQVAQGRRLVSVAVTTDAEDEEARSLMVDIGADEISSAADGTVHVIHRAPPGAVPPTA